MQRIAQYDNGTSNASKVLRVAQAAKVLEVSPRTIWRLVSLSKLEKVQVGRAVRVTRESIDRFIAKGGAR